MGFLIFTGGCQMTHVEMLCEGNLFIGFKMKGHAGYNTSGPDILCASLSTASQLIINGIIDWTGVDIDDVLHEEQVEAIVDFEIPFFLASPTTQQLFKSFEMFVEQLVEQYKGYVELERRQKDDNRD